jgi:hypothetical protein
VTKLLTCSFFQESLLPLLFSSSFYKQSLKQFDYGVTHYLILLFWLCPFFEFIENSALRNLVLFRSSGEQNMKEGICFLSSSPGAGNTG